MISYRPSFNGATSFQTWKWFLSRMKWRPHEQLQWGHVFSDVEIVSCPVHPQVKAELQWGHVFSDVEIRRWQSSATSPFGFNGATSFQTWK